MTRAKVQLAFMKNMKLRKNSLKKRIRGLIKKMEELTTLCEVEGCVIIYGLESPQPDVWPSNFGAHKVIANYRSRPHFEEMNQESFSDQQLAKAKEKLEDIQKQNRLKDLAILKNNINNGGLVQSLDDNNLTNTNETVLKPQLEEIEERIAFFNQTAGAQG